ncbi:hypothetical protein FO519_004358 [Halicephalobus sp. NKZ332]|nr:hypothetical protein FO519_004358 [Halicephalobus sp. NKZ332]
MLMPTSDRKKIYEQFFQDGVAIARKDYNLKSHPEVEGVKNLHVIRALKSLVSRGYAKEQFAWRHHYFYLTDEGTAYLRQYLGLEEEVIPTTHKPPTKSDIRPSFGDKGPRGFGGKTDSDRNAYRSDKVGEAGPGAAPIRGGFGR